QLAPGALLIMRVRRPQRRDLYNRHHATVFMRQNVAMEHVEARVINEAAAHLEVAGNTNRLASFGVYDRLEIFIKNRNTSRNWKGVPPDARPRRWRRRTTRLPSVRLMWV